MADDDIDALESYVAKATDRAVSSHPIDRRRLSIGGYSQGAWVAIAIAARRPDRYRAVIAVAPVGRTRIEPPQNTNGLGLDLKLFVGREDSDALPIATATEAAWQQRGWSVHLIPYEGGHKPPSSWPEILKDAAAPLAR